MAAAGIRKFTFDRVFTPDGREMRAGTSERFSYSPEEVEEIKKEAFAAGEQSAVAEAERAAAQALEAIAAAVTEIRGRLDAESSALRRDAVALSLAAARAAAEKALAAYPLEVLKGMFAECADSLRGAPHIRAFAPEHIREAAAQRLAERAAAAGLDGVISVEAGDGPARLEWGAGAAGVDPKAALEQAERAAERWLAAQDGEDAQLSLFDRASGDQESEQGESDDV
ncbi:MAG: hypothetical protein PVI23_08820 [Maricaulaceae bacterium]|jgi:flagellar assembly protein FliH